MYFAGVDIGSTMTKVVVVDDDGEIRSRVIGPTGAEHRRLANRVMEEALKEAGTTFGEIAYVVATGYGRFNVPFADRDITELTCHARGIASLFPSVRTAIDIGGQDAKGLKINDGKLIWQSGTGDRIFSSPVCSGGYVCVGSNDGKLYLFNERDGSLIWRRNTGKPVVSTPLVLSRTIYVGSDDGYLYGFDLKTGRRIMKRGLGTRFRAAPLWWDGYLYFAGDKRIGCNRVKGV